jgi:hypothetical protein
MKRFIVLSSFLVVLALTTAQAQCCKNAAQAKNCGKASSCMKTASLQNNNVSKIEAYYFHFTRRCATCQAVEDVSVETLKELYGDKVSFKSINLDEKANTELAKKLGVAGQSLLFVKGDKKVDITNDGFLYARTDPAKFKEKIKSTVESFK